MATLRYQCGHCNSWLSGESQIPIDRLSSASPETMHRCENSDGYHQAYLKYILDSNSITHLECGMTSYNVNDIENRYCGKCNEFLEAPAAPAE